MYKNGIKNTWTVDEIDFEKDITDLRTRLTPAENHLIHRLVAFFATGDSIVGNNLVINLVNAKARMYLSRQLYEEALHVQFYLTLLDNYIPNPDEREKAFSAVRENSVDQKEGRVLFKWIGFDQRNQKPRDDSRSSSLSNELNLFWLASRACSSSARLLTSISCAQKVCLTVLASGTNWVFRDESIHINFAFKAVETARAEEPGFFNRGIRENMVVSMMEEAIECEMAFAEDVLGGGVAGLSLKDMRRILSLSLTSVCALCTSFRAGT